MLEQHELACRNSLSHRAVSWIARRGIDIVLLKPLLREQRMSGDKGRFVARRNRCGTHRVQGWVCRGGAAFEEAPHTPRVLHLSRVSSLSRFSLLGSRSRLLGLRLGLTPLRQSATGDGGPMLLSRHTKSLAMETWLNCVSSRCLSSNGRRGG